MQWVRLVQVAGDSMAPALRHGDTVLVRWHARPRPGSVVVACFPDTPGVLVVKRVARLEPAGVWLVGDNAAASDDSRVHGAVPYGAVLGSVLCRLRRARQPRASSA